MTTTVASLQASIANTIQDSSYTSVTILGFINKCMHYIASKIDIKELYLTADLETVTDGNLIDLPDNFQRDLKRCYNLYTFGWAKVYGSRSLLDSKLGRLDLSGNVDAVAKYSNQLYYQRLPSSAQGLRIYYRAKPETLEAGDNIPDYIDDGYAHDLIHNWVCSKIYNDVEDSMESDRSNAIYYENLFKDALEDFRVFVGPEDDDPFLIEEVHSKFDFEDYE